LASAASVDISKFTTLQDGGYWIVLNIVLVLCGLWLALVLMVIEKVDLKFERFSF
jgi:hypothetical protein